MDVNLAFELHELLQRGDHYLFLSDAFKEATY